MWKANFPKETISKLYGHTDTMTTEKYLGINFDDMSNAMRQLESYEDALKTDNLAEGQREKDVKKVLQYLSPPGRRPKLPR